MWWSSILLTRGKIIIFTFVHLVSSQMQQKASGNSERQYAILGPIRKLMHWEVEQLTILTRGNLQGLPTNKNFRLELHEYVCQEKYFISQSFTVLQLPFFLPTFSTADTSNNKFANCFYLPYSFSGTQLFCDSSSSDLSTISLSMDAKGVCVYYCGARRKRR